jgi:hypothetical protein
MRVSHSETVTLDLEHKNGYTTSGTLTVELFISPEGLEKCVGQVVPDSLSVDCFGDLSIPYIVQLIDFGQDEDRIIRSVVWKELQDSIDAIDKARPILARHCGIRELKWILTHFLNQALDAPDLSQKSRKKYLKVLYKMCGHYERLPGAMRISATYDRTSGALHRGGCTDVWKGKCHDQEVAVKVVRKNSDGDLEREVGVSSLLLLFVCVLAC